MSVGLVATANADPPELLPGGAGVPGVIDEADVGGGDAAALTLAPVDDEIADLASNLTQRFADHPQFASAEVTIERDRVIVHWHGDLVEDLQRVLESADGIEIEVAQTPYRPGDMRQAAHELVESDPNVTSVSMAKDASSLEVTTAAAPRSGRALRTTPQGFPITSRQGGMSQASTRQNDLNLHLGGARLYQFDGAFIKGGCTSGFAVRKLHDSGRQGMMLAAHCGSVGSDWITSDGKFAYVYGKISQRTTAYDGAIIDSSWSQPYMWTNTWDSNVYTRIDGVANPYVGQELCYSGSYSGLNCGNIVTKTNVIYSLGGDLNSVTGFETKNNANMPAVGNGDSGGPGYQLVNTSSGLKRYAVGIISAIPTNSPAVCNGVPGSATRKCSPTVYATSVYSIAAAIGWYVPTS